MRAVIQRVSRASVDVDNETIGRKTKILREVLESP